MTREDYIVFCKRRANEYLDNGDVKNAIMSMLSDLGKHPETKADVTVVAHVGMLHAMNHDIEGARQFINGFY